MAMAWLAECYRFDGSSHHCAWVSFLGKSTLQLTISTTCPCVCSSYQYWSWGWWKAAEETITSITSSLLIYSREKQPNWDNTKRSFFDWHLTKIFSSRCSSPHLNGKACTTRRMYTYTQSGLFEGWSIWPRPRVKRREKRKKGQEKEGGKKARKREPQRPRKFYFEVHVLEVQIQLFFSKSTVNKTYKANHMMMLVGYSLEPRLFFRNNSFRLQKIRMINYPH